ncbi:MAG: hypothetical protein JWM50_387 [Microbacteriaceae bacterium]|nr:hypothetical protein [Microbacteriaceae bacterium]
MSHDDNLRRLAGKYKPNHRFANFGPIIERIDIRGFRGLSKLELELQSPIVALSGLNGTGKSTIAQLLCCGYRKIDGITQRNYVVDYFPVSGLDPQPFADDARVLYEYASKNPATAQQVTVSRAVKEWSGYKRQPERGAFYVGLMHFLPKIEKRDFSVYGGKRMEIGGSHSVGDATRTALSTVIGVPYDAAEFTRVTLAAKTAALAMVTRGPNRYSENHMGFGEGRMFYIINLLESAPAQSLFILEEPETALHGDAQVRLARYLVDVSLRRGHQVVLTTHSAAILGELSRESVVYLGRDAAGERSATVGLSTYQVDSYLHTSRSTDATICVEDEFAEALVCEILRAHKPDLLAGVSFFRAGSVSNLKNAVQILKGARKRAVGVSDPDMNDDGSDGLMSIEGTLAPEKEVFRDAAVKAYFNGPPYSYDIEPRLASETDHHHYPRSLSVALSVPETSIVTEACRAFVAGKPDDYFDNTIEFIRASLADRR